MRQAKQRWVVLHNEARTQAAVFEMDLHWPEERMPVLVARRDVDDENQVVCGRRRKVRVLVCGGRDYEDKGKVYDELDKLDREQGIDTLITGGAFGADSHAESWASQVMANRLDFQLMVFTPNWSVGRVAGPIRNQRMLDDGSPDLVLAFPGGPGTSDMIRRAAKAGVRVVEVEV